jgi:hypothetical protein
MEDEVSSSDFTWTLQEGLQGYADKNSDDSVSVEELFEYTYEICSSFPFYGFHPTLYDNYPGEYLLTMKELPPNPPVIQGQNILYNGAPVLFTAISTDPEDDKIQYGWKWNTYEDSSDEIDYWTNLYESGEICEINHTFLKPGIYSTRVKCRDEHGAEKIINSYSRPHITIMCKEDEIVDQSHCFLNRYSGLNKPQGQSFKPNSSSLSKIKLRLSYSSNGDDYPLQLSIRDDLEGEDLVVISKTIFTLENDESIRKWIDFNLTEPLNLTPQSTYHLVLENSYSGEGILGWGVNTQENIYLRGCAWGYSGSKWYPLEDWDKCFVTYR